MKILIKVFAFFKIILNKIKPFVDAYVLPAIKVADIIKDILLSPKADFLVSLTATKWDDEFLKKIRTALKDVILGLEILKFSKDELKDDIATINAFIEWLKGEEETTQRALLREVASGLVRALSPEKIKQFEADTLVQVAYMRKKRDESKA